VSTPPASDHQLGTVPLFESLSRETVDELAQSSRVREYPQGQILCNEGDPGDDLIVLEAGHLRISRFTADGEEVVLAVVEAPAVVGELALLDGAPRDASVTAQRAVTVRLIPRSVFLKLLEREHAAVEGLLKTLAGLVRAGNARHADFVGLDVPGRLAKWLFRQAEKPSGGQVAPGTVIELHSSQGELAAELGTTRSTLNRALQSFESLGLIQTDGSKVTIEQPEKLHSYTW
jgi:CRP/FNR family transcriptional regulator, cyclic AMP receptor protein